MRASSKFVELTIVVVAATALSTSAAYAGLTAEACQAKKLKAQGKFLLCRAGELAKGAQGKPVDIADCTERFSDTVAKLNAQAAGASIECRYQDNSDGTVTDLDTGLQWEKKTGDASFHDVSNQYTWSGSGIDPDGTVFTEFLPSFNECQSADGDVITGGLGNHCDWRLPSEAELRTIQLPFPCGSGPCIDPIFGSTASGFYWSSTTNSANTTQAWTSHFNSVDSTAAVGKTVGTLFARAVRGGL